MDFRAQPATRATERLVAAVFLRAPAACWWARTTVESTVAKLRSSAPRLADTVDLVLNRTVQRTEWSVPKLKADLAREPDNAIKKYRVVFAEGRGVAWNLDQTFNVKHEIKTVGVDQWVRENLN